MSRGLIPRDLEKCPVASLPGSVGYGGVNIPLIPRSEWSERIKEMERTKSRLSDIRRRFLGGSHIPSLDQNGQGYCADASTEVLTEKGWVGWPDYNGSDRLGTVSPLTNRMEFQSPLKHHVYNYKGEMVCSTNRRVDFSMTPDHRMLVRKWDERQRTLSNNYSFVRAADLGWYSGLMPAPAASIGTELVELEIEGDRRYDGDDLIMLLSLIVSDGYAGSSEKTRNWVSFCCFNPQRQESVAALARRVGFHEQTSRPGVWIRYDAGALADWVRANCYHGKDYSASSKRLPDLVKCASTRQIQLFLRTYGDQTHGSATPQFYSVSKALIDDLQILHLKIGKRSVVDTTAPRTSVIQSGENVGKAIHGNRAYVLTVGKVDRLCLDRKKHIASDRYNGLVYCATVPNGTLITRRNGTVLISGNCWMYSTTMAVMMFRAVANMPYVRLSAHAGACMIKGFRDEGGWCGLSMDWHMSRGNPSVEFWPEKSMSRSYDKPATWENAAQHRVLEGWVDLDAPVYNRELSFDQVMTLLLCRIPVAGDFNFWGHSVCLLDPVEIERGSFGPRGVNSWTDAWGDLGEFVLQGSKAVPDSAVAPRYTGFSIN
jgi:hypothetical protein